MLRLALIGGEEFAPGFEDVHSFLIQSAGGSHSRGVYIPAATADDGAATVDEWRKKAQEQLGAFSGQVDAPPIVDPVSANDPAHVRQVQQADWIYLGGGKPHVAMRILDGSVVLAAILERAQQGAVLMGASAGAMIMCARSFVLTPEAMRQFEQWFTRPPRPDEPPPQLPPLDCLNLIPQTICIPHFDHAHMARWRDQRLHPPGYTLIGIDEQTALVNLDGGWTIVGRGEVTLFKDHPEPTEHLAGERVPL